MIPAAMYSEPNWGEIQKARGGKQRLSWPYPLMVTGNMPNMERFRPVHIPSFFASLKVSKDNLLILINYSVTITFGIKF